MLHFVSAMAEATCVRWLLRLLLLLSFAFVDVSEGDHARLIAAVVALFALAVASAAAAATALTLGQGA